jgi:hypothetical protein
MKCTKLQLDFTLLGRHVTIDYDVDYGCERRTGWSIAVGLSYVVQFERSLVAALRRALPYFRRPQEI